MASIVPGARLPRSLGRHLPLKAYGLDAFGIAAFALPLLLYVSTLAPTIYNLDSAELTTAVATNGIVRATGYPLYLLLGKIWSWLPVGDMGYRLNLFSAFCGAATLFLLDRILRRLRVGLWARLGALGLLATAPYFWALSLIAEVYTLHAAMMAGTILLLLRWSDAPSPLRLALPILLLALSMGNHVATVLLIPGCVFFVLASQPTELLKGRVWLAAGIAGVAGLSIYLLLPLRYASAPLFNYAGTYDANGVFQPVNLQSLEGLWWLVSGKSFSGQMFGYGMHELWSEVSSFSHQLWVAFFTVGVGPGLLGFVLISRREKRVGGMLSLMFLVNAAFYINYRVVDKDTMFLPTYLVWALWVGVGYQTLLDWLALVAPQVRHRRPVHAILVSAVLLAMVVNWGRVDLSADWSTRERSEAILRQVQPNAIVFGWWETAPGLQYLQLVEGQRPDVTIINRFLISGEDMNQLILSELGQRPIYINNPSLALLRTARVTQVGPLYLIERSAADPPHAMQ